LIGAKIGDLDDLERHNAVTLTFDFLTLDFYRTTGVMCLNSVQNLSEIK